MRHKPLLPVHRNQIDLVASMEQCTEQLILVASVCVPDFDGRYRLLSSVYLSDVFLFVTWLTAKDTALPSIGHYQAQEAGCSYRSIRTYA